MDRDRLSAMISTLGRRHLVPAAQLAIHHNGRTVSAEFGEREHGTGSLVNEDVAFPVGSIGKSFTATAAMVLVADGDLELDEPIGAHLPELPADSTCARLSLRQLLTHTSGLPSSPDPTPGSASSLRRYVVAHCGRAELVDTPGRGFSYSNVGYVLTGRLIEFITGMNWWDAMESLVLGPLGIEPAFVVTPDGRSSRRPIATGHAVNTSTHRIRVVEQSVAPAEAPAGALAMSATDLVTFGLAHLGRTETPALLPEEYRERMWQPASGVDPFGMADGWGLGLALFRDGGRYWAGHDGTGDGTWCHLRLDPGDGTVVALTTNSNTGIGLWEDLVTELRNAGVEVAGGHALDVPADSVPPPMGCAGDYVNGDVEYSVRTDVGGNLLLAIDGDPHAWLTVHEGLTFSLCDLDSGQRMYAGRFLPDPATGTIDRIQITGRLARRY